MRRAVHPHFAQGVIKASATGRRVLILCTHSPTEGIHLASCQFQRSLRASLLIAMLNVRFLLTLMVPVLLLGCGNTVTSTSSPTTTVAQSESEAVASQLSTWRYVNSGWGSPYERQGTGAFTQQLRAFVITNQEELDSFQQDFALKKSWGTTTSLGRVDFPESILLAAYYLWRPYQGDPLSVVGLTVEGNQVDVLLELEESPQGKEYPYLYAPMAMVAIDRSQFSAGGAVDFVFYLNGELQETVVATVE